ncbi:unnamed protein product [Hyaloperonospora brassicae]|uniref:Uncharacterized protein n=1 Tax=Hyaloperonospora brassicae TaxID=162125 RepID=A0AAV0TUA8_HYABA|nr:unnamed protein product [Hyaloperonospora brassicae]
MLPSTGSFACPKEASRWVLLGRHLNFCKQYQRSIIAHTDKKHPVYLPSAELWFITYAVAPAIEDINVEFAKLQSRSLLLAQQQECINALTVKLTIMFCIEVVDLDDSYDNDEAGFVSVGSTRIDVMGIKSHIHDQGLASGEHRDRLEANDQNYFIKQIAMYVIMLVHGLMGVKAERDENNLHLDHGALTVMPQQLVRLLPSKFF